VDDEHIITYQYSYNAERPLTDAERARAINSMELERVKYTLPDGVIIDINRSVRAPENDYLIDREMQRTQNYTGIPFGRHQDFAMTDSMGSISDRTKEHLGTSDTAIIAARRIILKTVRDLQEGVEPYAASHPEVFHVRALDIVSSEGDFVKLLEADGEKTLADV
jgi:hypothetical protein